MNALLRWLIDAGFSSGLVLLLGTAVTALLKRPALRQRVAELALLAALASAALAALPGVHRFSINLFHLPASSAPVSSPVHIGLLPWQGHIHHALGQPIGAPAPAVPSVLGRRPSAATLWRELGTAIIGLYFLGVLALLLRLLLGFAMVQSIIRSAQPLRDPLELHAGLRNDIHRLNVVILESSRIASPMTAGWRRPVILLPAGLGANQKISLVVAHELAHIRRSDALSRYLCALAGTVMFFNPLVVWLRRQIRLSQEMVADAAAIGMADHGPQGAVLYAELLLNLIRARPPTPAGSMAASHLIGRSADMVARLERVIAGSPVGNPSGDRKVMAFCMFGALAAASTASMVTLNGRGGAIGGHRAMPNISAADARVPAQHLLRMGLAYLASRQNAGGAWLGRFGPAITALVVRGYLQAGVPAANVHVQAGMRFIESCRHSDHGFYRHDEPAYITAIVARTLSMLPGAAYQRQCKQAIAFLRQNLPMRSSRSRRISAWFTGAAARSTAAAPAYATAPPHGMHLQDALWISTAALDPSERSGADVLAAYGDITYAQLKSMIYAGLTPRDPRVIRLAGWLKYQRQLNVNPATHGARGLYYFYLVFARVMRIADVSGTLPHQRHWRRRLVATLQKAMRPGGFWQNTRSPGWLEGSRIMATTYAVLALDQVVKTKR